VSKICKKKGRGCKGGQEKGPKGSNSTGGEKGRYQERRCLEVPHDAPFKKKNGAIKKKNVPLRERKGQQQKRIEGVPVSPSEPLWEKTPKGGKPPLAQKKKRGKTGRKT